MKERENNITDVEEELANFCHNVLFLRTKFDFSQKRMSEIMGISIASLNQIESGNVPFEVTCAVLVYLANFFYLTPNTIIQTKLDQ